ncbi:MAG TPA: cyclopropane-fatty-acyl-phospholipid synthase family protein [Kofleriaceae bacterium]|nr:cyclopropane-fatty-acyl-phospholipid synthase family protein [Kofleriaceae bacterium]
MIVEALVDSGLVPEPVLRAAIRRVCAARLRACVRGGGLAASERQRAFVEELRAAPIAVATEAANAQHYEVPADFFGLVLGPRRKYSSAYWPAGVATLAAAEEAMLELTAARAGLADGQHILDLGCGWGSFALWAAARFPASRITAVSNSRSQRAHIATTALARGLPNLEVITGDVRSLALPAAAFDRVVSIEMFEHMRNYRALLARIAGWLAPRGSLFVHVFAHRRWAYPYDDAGASDWMAREFFTGGLMPSVPLFLHFQDDLRVAEQWVLPGTHYARTAEAWHANLLAQSTAVTALLGRRHFHRWRVFFLACAELFGFAGGDEWVVAHHRFVRR